MSVSNKRLGEIEPRERAGAQTGRRYEYQYERTARATLDLLSDQTKHICIYCDWHDDYVAEFGNPPSRYLFHQVKGRKSSQGPWKFSDFFGVLKKKAAKPSPKPATVDSDAIVSRMLLHHTNFSANCAGLVFVTNAGLDPDLSKFLQTLSEHSSESDLPVEEQIAFRHVARAYVAAKFAPSESDLFKWLRGLTIHTDQGQLEQPDAALLEIADVVEDYSEIDLSQRQAKQIAREIVSCVRLKAAHSTTKVPASDEQLRQEKGIVISELLTVLSLSTQAYEQLKAGDGPDAVKTLSRLHRFCRKHGFEEHLPAICDFKARWDVWRTVERHFFNGTDYILLERKAREALREGLKLERVVNEAKDIAKQFEGLPGKPLTPECVLGLIFSLAAQAEAQPVQGSGKGKNGH